MAWRRRSVPTSHGSSFHTNPFHAYRPRVKSLVSKRVSNVQLMMSRQKHGEQLTRDVPVKQEVPKEGNLLLSQSEWTMAEQDLLDGNMKAFARWEVDYKNREVRSTHCWHLTTNTSSICDACEGLVKDQSLKDTVRRVSCSLVIDKCSRRYSLDLEVDGVAVARRRATCGPHIA